MQMKSREEAAPKLQGRCWTRLQGKVIKQAPHSMLFKCDAYHNTLVP